MASKEGLVDFSDLDRIWTTEQDVKEVVDAVKACENLTELKLCGNSIGPEASKFLSLALSSKKSLKILNLSSIFTGRNEKDIVDSLESIFEGIIQSQCNFEELDMSDNALGPHGISTLRTLFSSKVVCSLRVLKLNNDGIGVGAATTLSEVLERTLKYCQEELKIKFSLSTLMLNSNKMEAEGVKILSPTLSKLSELTRIEIEQNSVTIPGVIAFCKAIKSLEKLEIVNLKDSYMMDEASPSIADLFSSLPCLKELDLGDGAIGDEGIELVVNQIIEHKPKLTRLDISFSSISGEWLIKLIHSLSYLSPMRKNSEDYQGDFQLVIFGNNFCPENFDGIRATWLQYNFKKDLLVFVEDEDELEFYNTCDLPSSEALETNHNYAETSDYSISDLVDRIEKISL